MKPVKEKVLEIVAKVKKSLNSPKKKIDAILKKEGIRTGIDYSWRRENIIRPNTKGLSEAISDALATEDIEIEISDDFKEIKIISK